MAHRGIREYDAKKWFYCFMKERYADIYGSYENEMILVTPETNLKDLSKKYAWLQSGELVVKPDQLFGKRGKLRLIMLKVSLDDAKRFIFLKRTNQITIDKKTGILTHFLIEKFVAHTDEYYLAITSEREGERIYFSRKGGIEIEENWDKVKSFFVPILDTIDKKKLFFELGLDLKIQLDHIIGDFIPKMWQFYKEYNLVYLEFNPFVITFQGLIIPLDVVAKADDTAYLIQDDHRLGKIEFPQAFGTSMSPEEAFVRSLDEKSGASLKLTVLNPAGRIWTMVAGGGASVIFADTICDLGFGKELANYGEYSGNPSKEETYEYAKTILGLMSKKPHPKGKILIIGGAIANFTDVAKTFEGIIQALIEYHSVLKKHKVKIFVRRGGPNYEIGLKNMAKFGKKYGLKVQVYGPETHMTRVVKIGLNV